MSRICLPLIALALLTAAPLASAQTDAASAPAVAPPTGGAAAGLPAASEAEGSSKGWLMSSPLVDVGWPEIKMPKVKWKPFGGGGSEDAAAAPRPNPITRVTQATQGALQRGRSAWNSTVDKMKIGPFRSKKPADAQAEPSFFAKMFGGQEQPQRAETVAEFIGQDRPTMR